MPKRMLKDYTNSEKVNILSPIAEVCFVRLMMKADDYGSFHGNPKLLNAALFPLREYIDAVIQEAFAELLAAGLIITYTANDKPYVRIIDFEQRMRQKRNAYPHPPQHAADAPLEEEGNSNKKIEVELEGDTHSKIPTVDEFLDYCQNIEGIDYSRLKFSLQAKFETWVENGWKDGNDKKIKNWKTKIKNVIPFLRPIGAPTIGAVPKHQSALNDLDEQLRELRRT